MNKFELQKQLEALPEDMDKRILKILSNFHVGRSRAIPRFDLLRNLRQHGFHVNERVMREQIKQLRLRGYLIGSASGEGGGYYVIVSRHEFEEFIEREFRSKIIDMSATVRALEGHADLQFGQDYQPNLF